MMQSWIQLKIEAVEWWAAIREILPDLRIEAGLSQRELGRILGTSQGNISGAELRRGDIWSISRTISWLAAVGYEIAATSPEGKIHALSTWDVATARWLASVRQARGITQVDLAGRIGIAESTLQVLESRAPKSETTTIAAYLIACGWTLSIRPSGKRTPLPAERHVSENRPTWRESARSRALTRLRWEVPAEYNQAYRDVQSSAGGTLPAHRARTTTLARIAREHNDRFREIYRQELIKGAAPGGMTGGGSQEAEG